MRHFYSLTVYFYYLLVWFASHFNSKASKWIEGRKGLLHKIKKELRPGYIVWIHSASVGEFEQARPLIERIKKEYPHKKILVTFFSPSGYELRKNYPLADYIYYLPIDTPKNARDFIQIIQPEIVFFVKYEFWYNYIIELHQRNIPLYLLSGIFRPKQYFFKSYAKWFKDKLGYFEHIFLQDQQSMRLLLEVGLQNVSVSGDTRFDRVYSNTLLPNQFDSVFQFCKNSRVIIAGSTWKKDEQLLQRAISSSLFETILPQETIKLIIAPHEVDESHLQSIEHLFKELKPIRWSEISKQPNYAHESKILLIDSVGSLMHLYQYADIAYIGGGFGAGIHNILEAACFGKPIIFGPNYRKFKEAIDLIQLKAAFCVNNTSELNETLIDLFQNNLQFNRIETSCKKYIIDNLGATNIVFNRSFGYNQLEFSAIEE